MTDIIKRGERTMKINGTNQTNFNAYKNQMQKQAEVKKEVDREDQLEISNQAKQLQESEMFQAKRSAHVQQIKDEVKSGEYKIDPEKIAKKMIALWSKK
jgi:negative regulator of flagellin synthesis FlgM